MPQSEQNKSFSQMLDEFQAKCDDVLENYIFDGYLKTFAGILSYMSEERAQKILLSLDQDRRQKIEYIMNHNLCNPKFEAESAFASMKFAPLEDLTKIEKQRRREMDTEEIMRNFEGRNPIFGKYLKKMHFNFNEIIMLDDRAVQKILREIDSTDLAKALKNSDEETKNKIFRNMSKNAADMLKEEIEFLGPLREKDIFESQAKITSTILRLEADGEIIRPSFEDDNDVEVLLQNEIGPLLAANNQGE